MNRINKILLTVICFCLSNTMEAQTIKEKFDQLLYKENFDSSKTDWPVVSNNENLLIIQEGEYILSRKTGLSEFLIQSDQHFNVDGFKLMSSLKLDKAATENGSIGLLFMMQEENGGGIILEFNMKKEYRLRRFKENNFVCITGSEKGGGWTKNNYINEATIPTLVELRYLKGVFDLYFNNKFVITFNEAEFTGGSLGFVIGAATKGRVDYLYLFTNASNITAMKALEKKPEPAANSSLDLATLATAIIELKTKVNALTEENNLLKRTVDAMKSEDIEKMTEKKMMLAKLSVHDSEMIAVQKRYDSLVTVNQDLEKYKEMVTGNENSDLLISITKQMKLELDKNKILQLRIDSLNRIANDGALKQTIPTTTIQESKGTIDSTANKPANNSQNKAPQNSAPATIPPPTIKPTTNTGTTNLPATKQPATNPPANKSNTPPVNNFQPK